MRAALGVNRVASRIERQSTGNARGIAVRAVFHAPSAPDPKGTCASFVSLGRLGLSAHSEASVVLTATSNASPASRFGTSISRSDVKRLIRSGSVPLGQHHGPFLSKVTISGRSNRLSFRLRRSGCTSHNSLITGLTHHASGLTETALLNRTLSVDSGRCGIAMMNCRPSRSMAVIAG